MHVFKMMERLHEDCGRRIRNGLPAKQFDAAWDQGSRLTFRQATDFALTEAASESDAQTLAERLPIVSSARDLSP